jgi:DNA-directed RNA polymerase beta subunit
MAHTYATVSSKAAEARQIAASVRSLYYDLKQYLDTNTHLSIDWGAAQKPAYINEQANGNLEGHEFTRQAISNLIGTFDTLRTTIEAGHLGNVSNVVK